MNYTRQESLELRIPKQVVVVGCGGVGSWCAKLLALAGVETLWLFDPDKVSDHNLNRLPLSLDSIGKYKSEALAEELYRFRPTGNFLALRTFTPVVANSLGCATVEWVMCTTDTHASRVMAYQWAMGNGIRYIEAAAEGDIGSMAGSPAEWTTADEINPGYASVPVWVGPSVAAAYLAVTHILHGMGPGDRIIRMGVEKPARPILRKFQIFDTHKEAGQ